MTDTLHVEYIPLDQLSFWDRNPKAHDLGALIRSFERHGFKQPPRYEPTLNDGAGGIVAGNGRIEALQAMRNAGHDAPRGIEVQDGAWYVPVLFGVDAASQAAAEAYGLDDNNMVMAGGDFTAIDQARAWHANYLDLLQELAAADELPVSVDGDDLDALLAYNAPEIVPGNGGDEFDTTPDDGPTRAQLGDLWIIGGVHRLLVGDCTDPANVARLMQGERAAMVWADPPFGIEYTGHGESVDGRANKFAPIAGDDAPCGDWLPFWIPNDNGAMYLKTTWAVLHEWEQFIASLLRLKSRIVWDKCSHVAGDVMGGYATQSEVILYAVLGKHKINQFDTDVWRIARATTGAPELRSGHPYESPVGLPSRAIENSSQRGNVIADPFLGSGTTLIAAHRTGRRCYGMELAPKYADVILRRAEAEGLTVELQPHEREVTP